MKKYYKVCLLLIVAFITCVLLVSTSPRGAIRIYTAFAGAPIKATKISTEYGGKDAYGKIYSITNNNFASDGSGALVDFHVKKIGPFYVAILGV